MKILDRFKKQKIQVLSCSNCNTDLMRLHRLGGATWANCSICGKTKWKFEENVITEPLMN